MPIMIFQPMDPPPIIFITSTLPMVQLVGLPPDTPMVLFSSFDMNPNQNCHTPLHEECMKHHGHKGKPRVTPNTYGAVGERAQMILVWVMAPGVGIASYPRKLRVIRVRP